MNLLKNDWAKNLPKPIKIIAKIIFYIFLAILILFIGLVIYRLPVVIEQNNTKEIVDNIHSQKLTMADVEGKNLPPSPNPKLNNSTLNGIDVNANGIRDDVEIAIFKLYPDSARIRSGALQYAKAMQNYFRKDITNSKIFVAVMQEDGRGDLCFYHNLPKIDFTKGDKEINKAFAIKDAKNEEIENLVFNTKIRKNKKDENYKKYMTSFGSKEGSNCDIDPLSLLN